MLHKQLFSSSKHMVTRSMETIKNFPLFNVLCSILIDNTTVFYLSLIIVVKFILQPNCFVGIFMESFLQTKKYLLLYIRFLYDMM